MLGSTSYQRPDAKMLVTEDREITVAISGECLEGTDAIGTAEQVATTLQQQTNQ